MGLEGVEILMDCEEQFGVTIEEKEAEKTITPGMLIDLIFSKLSSTDELTCQSRQAFYLLRRGLAGSTEAQRKDIRPDTPLATLLQTQDAQTVWPALQASVDARSWPKLRRLWWMRLILWALAGVTVLVVFHFFSVGSLWLQALLAVPVLVLVLVPLLRLTEGLKRSVPSRLKRVRDLVPYAITSNRIKWTRQQVADKVKSIVCENLNVGDSVYREDAHFVNDLGMG